MISLVFFFNDTATTEIYTYRHTLSRPYALPSSGRDGATFRRPRTGQAGLGRELDQCTDGPHRRRRRRDAAEHDRREDPRPAAGPSPRQGRPLQPDSRLTTRNKTMARSEEHTSELQSLMRISYAVFCLQKKTYTPDK